MTKKQIEWLESPNSIIRYWAILGLRSQKLNVLEAYSEKIAEMMEDEYPPVGVTAAAILWELENSDRAEEKMKSFCASENLNISLMAINYLLYSDNKEPFVETIWKVHKMEDRDYNVLAACMDFLGSLRLVPNNPDYRR